MSGIAFGSKHLRTIPANVQNYDAITSIEFIEQEQKTDNIRSAAYRPVQGGGQTRIRTGVQDDLIDTDLSLKEATEYIDALVSAGIFDWDYSYRPAQGNFTNVNCQWRLKIEFNEAAKEKPFIAEGESCFPDNYETITAILLRQSE